MINIEDDCVGCKDPQYFDGRCNELGVRKIKRPSQSWCYVEGMVDE